MVRAEYIVKRFFGFTVIIMIALPVWGHHSDSGMDRNTVVTLEGRVVEFRWRNPHVYITIDTTDEHGNEVVWKLEAGAISVMSRMG
ncbi:unnamed protein product, partial [marine sediment metagenome]